MRAIRAARAAAGATLVALCPPERFSLAADSRARVQAAPEAEPEPVGAQRDAAALGIDGLWLFPDFVDAAEEASLLAHVDADGARWQRLARRRVLHEGFRFDYAVRRSTQRRGQRC